MSSFNAAQTLKRNFTDNPITIYPERCLNARHQAVNCTLCAECCPSEAIIVIDGKPDLYHEACLHCGLCLHNCPTGVFDQADIITRGLIKIMETLSAKPVDLLCPEHPNPNLGPALHAVETKRCLAALSPSTMLELATLGYEICLDDTPCAKCVLAQIHPYLCQTVAEANTWGLLLKNTNPISLRTQQSDELPVAHRLSYEADQPSVSRRDFFGLVKQLLQQNLSTVIKEDSADALQASKSQHLPPSSIPPERAKLLSLITSFPISESIVSLDTCEERYGSQTQLPIAEVSVDASQCSACGWCARLCPTGALTLKNDDNCFALNFDPILCLGQNCNICTIACPEKVVKTDQAIISAELLSQESRQLVAGKLVSCQQCGMLIAARQKRPASCFACSTGGMPTDFSKSLKWSSR